MWSFVTSVTRDRFSGILEIMFLKLNYVFTSLFFSLFLWEVELEISFSTYFIRYTCWFNSSSFKYEIQKMNRHLLGKNFDVFTQNSTFFLQILMIILKMDVTLKLFLAMQFFNYLLNQLLPWNFLCSFIAPLDNSGYYFI